MRKRIIAPLMAVAFMLPIGALAQADDETPAAPEMQATSVPTMTPTPYRRYRHTMTPAPVETEVPAAAASPEAMRTPRNKTQRFMTETAAQAECPNDTVVWMNTRSHAVHHKGDKYYGKTKSGSYVCEHAK